MAKTKKYTDEDIKVLSDRDHVRKRTQVYLGNMDEMDYDVPVFKENGSFAVEHLTFIPAVFKAVGEITDNSIDEFAQIDNKNKILSIKANPEQGEYTIQDNGRGIPISKHSTGKYTPEVALASLRAGRNFNDGKQAGVVGQNGVGSACTNYCSTEFTATIVRDNQKYIQKFSDGAAKISKPTIRKSKSTKSGTTIKFKLDPSVFSNISLPSILIRARANEIAFLNPSITVEYNEEKFKYKKGLEDVIKSLTDKVKNASYFKFEYKSDIIEMEFFIVLGINEGIDEKIFTWVNSSYLFDGGMCNTQFLNAFCDKVETKLESSAKKAKCQITKNDIRENLMVFGNLKLSDPKYDGQAKTRLTGPNLRKEMKDMLDESWKVFAKKNKPYLDNVLNNAIHRYHKKADKEAVKEHKKAISKKIPNLLDATSHIRTDCQLLITEGESASAGIIEARDPKTTAALPLTGKINNVWNERPAGILGMSKLTDLLASIGLVPGKRAIRSELRYGRIVIATDADPDGGDIFTLLVNLFYNFWPELFDPAYPAFVYRLTAPNICLVKGDKRVHFPTREEYEKQKHKYKNGWNVKYYKGLGSMVFDDWDMLLSGKTDTLIPITDDSKIQETLELLFGPSSDNRKEWLQS